MVVEGWLPDYAIEEALKEYRAGGYTLLFTTGAPLERGAFLSEYGDYATVAAATLRRLGLATNQVQAIPSTERHRNRTYASALALRQYCAQTGITLKSINLVTQGTHARRSRLCFQRALGREVVVGVVSLDNRDYNSKQWWKFSAGVKSILSECLGLLYAWLSIDYGD